MFGNWSPLSEEMFRSPQNTERKCEATLVAVREGRQEPVPLGTPEAQQGTLGCL